MKDLLINPDQISKIIIDPNVKRYLYEINQSVWTIFPFVPSIKVYKTPSDAMNKKIYKTFNRYEDFCLWLLFQDFPRTALPNKEFFWESHDLEEVWNHMHITFYDLKQKEINRMDFKDHTEMRKIIMKLKSLKFIHTTISD